MQINHLTERDKRINALERYTFIQYNIEHTIKDPLVPGTGLELENAYELLQIGYIIQYLTRHDYEPPFYKGYKHYRLGAQATEHGQWLLDLLIKLTQPEENLWLAKHHYDASPDVSKLLEICKAAINNQPSYVDGVGLIRPLPIDPSDYKYTERRQVDAIVASFAELSQTIRKALLNRELKARVKSFKRNAKERQKQAQRITEQAWNIHSSVLLLRLDWGFRKDYYSAQYSTMSQPEFEATFAKVSRYRKQMVKSLKKMFGKDLAFYIWKIECGERKGLHIHWLIGLNGSKHQQNVTVGKQIQECWDAEINDNETYTFNVNGIYAAKESGLRVIDYHDPDLWEIVDRYVDYLLKVDYTIKLRIPAGMRSFGCSQPKKTPKNKTGPKRKFNLISTGSRSTLRFNRFQKNTI